MSDDIGLLLSRFDADEPFLQEGIPLESAAERPRPADEDPGCYDYDGGDQGSLPDQRWGIVAPEGEVGDRLLARVAPLQARREEQMGIAKGTTWIRRVPPGMGDDEAGDWIEDVWRDEDVPQRDRPRYLLLLGDADLVSWTLQKKLTAACALVGRLALPTDEGYEAYASKVLASEGDAPAKSVRALFYCVRGDPVTDQGYRALVQPTLEDAQDARKVGAFNAQQIVEVGEGSNVGVDEFLRAAAEADPTMMFTMSHGAGVPRAGWESLDKKHAFQGAMCFGAGERVTYDLVSKGSFLPGGLWFFFACFGAGTPSISAYDIWLEKLKEVGKFRGAVGDLYTALPKEGERPFVAALPQAALANPDGPLAVVGHVDLAWTYGFQDHGDKGKRARTSRFTDVFRSLVDGKRAGLGLNALQPTLYRTNDALNTLYAQEERARRKGVALDDEKARTMKKASLWMTREDISAYVLLGDPAARLNVAPGGRP